MNDTPAPLSADSLRDAVKQELSKAYYNGLDRKGWSVYEEKTAVDRIMQRLADSLTAEANTYTTVLQGYEGKIEAVPVEAVRAVLGEEK